MSTNHNTLEIQVDGDISDININIIDNKEEEISRISYLPSSNLEHNQGEDIYKVEEPVKKKKHGIKCTPSTPVVYRNNTEVAMALTYLKSVGISKSIISGCEKILNSKEGKIITNADILLKLKHEGVRHPKLNGIISAVFKYLDSAVR